MDQQALKPDVFVNFKNIKLRKEAIKKGVDEDELAIAELSNMRGWVLLVERIGRMKEQMNQLIKMAIGEGADFEKVGKLTVVTDLVNEKLDEITSTVADAKRSTEGE